MGFDLTTLAGAFGALGLAGVVIFWLARRNIASAIREGQEVIEKNRETETRKRVEQDVKDKREVDQEVDNMSDDDVDDFLREHATRSER